MNSVHYSIKPKKRSLIALYIGVFCIQLGCFKFIEYSEYITIPFCIAVIVLILLFIWSLFSIFLILKNGLPQIKFDRDSLNLHSLTKKTTLPLNYIKELKLKRIESNSRMNAFAPSREINLILSKSILISQIYPFKSKEHIQFSIWSSLFFTEDQILEAVLIITILCRIKVKQRAKIIHELNKQPIIWTSLITQKEIANFKYNQEISKKFNSVQ